MAPDAQVKDGPTCPECGHVNVPGAAFCANCGRSLDDEAPAPQASAAAPADSQATSSFEPVTDTVAAPDTSPWARPASLDGDPGLTTALPSPPPYSPAIAPAEEERMMRSPQGTRGFWLGVVALLLIVAVLAVYVYAAWLGDSARATVDGWLPWT